MTAGNPARRRQRRTDRDHRNCSSSARHRTSRRRWATSGQL